MSTLNLENSPRTVRAELDIPYRHVDTHFIGGQWVQAHASERADVVDPATGQVWGSVPRGNDDDLNAAVAAAKDAFDAGAWSGLEAAERAQYLNRIADEIEARAEILSWTNSLENGSPVAETAGAAANAAGIFRYFATLAHVIDEEDVRPAPRGGFSSTVKRDPVGVCALIAPWNFPINLVVIKLAPALLAGCTVVIKPASPTPVSIRIVMDAIAAAGVPAGMVNMVTGSGQMGDKLVRHPDVAKVAFTGSTPVGRKIAAACGELLRPVTLELGGKSSAVILPDVDVEVLRANLVRSCLRNTGQTCYISTRLIVPTSRYEEIVQLVAEEISGAAQGDPLAEATVFGPCATESQYNTVLEYIDSAKAEGARCVTGGEPADLAGELGQGFFVKPTVFADVTPDMRIAREEIFGPVISMIKYDDSSGVEEAIAIANNTEFGLGGIVFTADEEAGKAVAEKIDSGSVGVNFFASNHAAPFGGRHDSGMGVEYGPEGLHAYLIYKSIHHR